jgi:ComF family protein
MIYDDASRPFILSFKHGGKTENLARFAAQLRRAGRGVLPEADYIIPVPLHTKRRVQRRYNQSALLARALAKITTVEFDPNLLRRVRHTLSQGGQSAKGRRRNVRGAFAVPDEAKPRLKGAQIVIVDDVMTTGATVEACASTLLRSGAKRVDILCLARVIRTDMTNKENIHGQS